MEINNALSIVQTEVDVETKLESNPKFIRSSTTMFQGEIYRKMNRFCLSINGASLGII